MKTIKQLADELKTNKTKIRRIINKWNIKTERKQNILYISVLAEKQIRERFYYKVERNESGTKVEQKTESVSLEILQKQLKEKDKQIENLTKLLDQQQQLTLQANKLLTTEKQLQLVAGVEKENNKKWYKFWK